MNRSTLLGILGFVIGMAVIGGGLFLAGGGLKQEPTATVAPPKPPAQTPAAPQDAAPSRIPDVPGNVIPTKLSLSRTIAAYEPGGAADVVIQISMEGNDPVRALGLQENIPQGWKFGGIIDGSRPDLNPSSGREEILEFAWFNIPDFPTTFTYRLETTAEAPTPISGEVIFRTGGEELRSGVVTTPVTPGGSPAAAASPAPAPAPEAAAKAETPAANSMAFTRTVLAQGYTPGAPLEVKLDVNYTGADIVTAFAIQEQLPEAWTFEEVSAGTKAPFPPDKGRSGTLTFLWISPPEWPLSFTYLVSVPAGESGPQAISGEAVYRTIAEELRTGVTTSTLTPLSS